MADKLLPERRSISKMILDAMNELQQRITVGEAELEVCRGALDTKCVELTASLQREAALEIEVAGLRAFKASVDEALNMGDGSYRP